MRDRLAGNAHLLGHVGLRPSLPDNAINNGPAAVEGQPGITVGHENLRSEWVLDKPHPNRRFSSDQRPDRACPTNPAVTNVLAGYN